MTDNIKFTEDAGAELAHFLKERSYSSVCVLTDTNTSTHCYPRIRQSLPDHQEILVPSGEERKNLETCEIIWEKMTSFQMDRHALVVILGGGVLGDMGGFCAATYKRGIDFVLIPTTLLSQVDASIGGKLGIDFRHFKNHIGVFKTPVLTILDAAFLQTLPSSEKRSGFAEVIKHALIADAPVWNKLKRHGLEEQDWPTLLQHSVNVKLNVVQKDPYENGLRKILNAGHTIGHAVETYLLQSDRKILHGEAIAIGLIAETFLASEKQMLPEEEFQDIVRYLLKIYGKVPLTEHDDDAIAQLTTQDKKNRGKRILCVLLEGIGNAKWDCEISTNEVKKALAFYRSA